MRGDNPIFHAATIFLSAFLLFLVQPVIAKQILPWFGGAAAVWTTCLVFFQTSLLAGYAYSDFVARKLALPTQVKLHSALLVVSLAFLPIIPAAHWKPTGIEDPPLQILGMLAATIGLPYFLLSATSPIVQSWFAKARPGASPYRLFALSNAASMLALVGYPFLLEPWAPTRAQALGWSIGYAAFIALCIAAGWSSLAQRTPVPEVVALPARRPRKSKRKDVPAPSAMSANKQDVAPTASRQALWAILAATAVLLLLAITNHITQNVASVPLLWILPLALYLSTFILCFDSPRWYRRNVVIVLLAAGLPAMGWALVSPSAENQLGLQIGVFCVGLFLACMFCHGEIARLKPVPTYVTRFYLMIALGGAAGSVLVGIVAPLVLPANFELEGGLVATAMLLLWQVRRGPAGLPALGVAVTIAAIGFAGWSIHEFYFGTVAASRNFYGVLRVREAGVGDLRFRALVHGNIRHGTQYPSLPGYPTNYYVPTSGIGRLFSQRPSVPIRVGVIGLGIGTLAAYGVQGDVMRFYEIDPAVLRVAQRDFSYLKDSQATVQMVLGDARLSLEREPNQAFDVLVVDAFFGDAIPVHLLTTEALGIYMHHMKPGGVIAIHVTNRFLNLIPVVAALAEAHHLYALHVEDRTAKEPAYASDWVLLSEQRESLNRPRVVEVAKPVQTRRDWRLWTDDFNNLVQVLK